MGLDVRFFGQGAPVLPTEWGLRLVTSEVIGQKGKKEYIAPDYVGGVQWSLKKAQSKSKD